MSKPTNARLQRLLPHLSALTLYLILAVVALDNLVQHFATAIPMTFNWDYAIFYWDLWWIKYALFNLHRDPMFTNYVLYPYNVNLALHVHSFTLGLLSAPFQDWLDLKLIFNTITVASFVTSGYFTFVFLRRHVSNDWLAALGGTLFAFTPITIGRAAGGNLNLLPLAWLPIHLLLWDGIISRSAPWKRIAAAAGLGLALYLAWMTDIQFLLWTAPLLAPYTLYTWITQCRGQISNVNPPQERGAGCQMSKPRALYAWIAQYGGRERVRVLGLAGLAGVFMLAPALIEPIPALLQTRGLKYSATDAYSVQAYSYPPSWLVARDPGRADENMGQLLPFLTLACLPLTGRRRQRWLWLAVGIGSLILALGPFLQGTNIPLPYLLLHRLMGEQYRTPYRFTTPASFALVVFVALSLANLLERSRIVARRLPWIAGAVMLVWVFDSDILAPFPVDTMPDYDIYHQIGRDPDEYALLEIPVGPASGFGEFGDSPNLQYYAYIHHKQLINGTVSRIPSDGLDRFERSPLLRGLTGEYNLPSFEAASAELANKLTNWDLRYVLVHRDRLPPERVRAIVQFLNVQPELCLVDEQGDLLAYRRISAWTDCPRPEMTALPSAARLSLSDPRSERHIGPGWYDVEDIGGQAARWAGEISTSTLRLVPPPGAAAMRFRAMGYTDQQTVTVSFDGRPVAVVNLKNDWAEYQIQLPPGVLPAQGPVVISLAHQRLASPFDRTSGASPDRRPLSAAYAYIDFSPAP